MYNPDGSAYILEEEDLLSQVPRQEGSIVDRAGANNQVAAYNNFLCMMGFIINVLSAYIVFT